MSPVLATAQWVLLSAYPLTLAWAMVSDARHLMIPNWTCIIIAAAYLPAALLGSVDISVIALHYGVGAGLFLAGLYPFSRGLIGGGDLKLLAAAGIWTGWNDLWSYLVLVALLGGALAVVVLIARRLQKKLPILDKVEWLKGGDGPVKPIPYGIAIGLGAGFLFPGNSALPPSWAAALGG